MIQSWGTRFFSIKNIKAKNKNFKISFMTTAAILNTFSYGLYPTSSTTYPTTIPAHASIVIAIFLSPILKSITKNINTALANK